MIRWAHPSRLMRLLSLLAIAVLCACAPQTETSTDEPVTVRGYLPSPPVESATFILVELIKLDMAAAAESGDVPRIERYVQALPELINADTVPGELVLEELQLRKGSGEQPELDEYEKRFPQFGSVLGKVLGVAEVTNAVHSTGAPPQVEVGTRIDDFLIIQTLGAGAFASAG